MSWLPPVKVGTVVAALVVAEVLADVVTDLVRDARNRRRAPAKPAGYFRPGRFTETGAGDSGFVEEARAHLRSVDTRRAHGGLR